MARERPKLPPPVDVTPYLVSSTLHLHGALIELVVKRHRFVPCNIVGTPPLVCITCRATGGNRATWPCAEFVELATLLGVKLKPRVFLRLGVSLPAQLVAA